MAATKTRKKVTAKKPVKKAKKAIKMKAKPAARKSAVKARPAKKPAPASRKKKLTQPPPHPDQTSVRLGPHHVDRHPVEGGIHVHPAPMTHIMPKRLPVVVRHH